VNAITIEAKNFLPNKTPNISLKRKKQPYQLTTGDYGRLYGFKKIDLVKGGVLESRPESKSGFYEI
jgi:hypothetical protein